MTKSTKTKKQLNETTSRLQQLIDALPVYVSYLNTEHQILFVNKQYERWLNVPREELIGKHVSEVIGEDTFRETQEYFFRPLNNETIEFDHFIEEVSGTKYYHIVHVPDFQEGQVKGIFVLVHDITERKLFEQQLIETKEIAEQANKAKSQFLERMSHEFRTPLNAILGFAQVLDTKTEESSQPQNKSDIQHILNAGWHMLDVVNNLLDLASIEANKLELNIESVSLMTNVIESMDIMEPLAKQREITLNREVLNSCDQLFILADQVRFKQVLLNLLSNAVKYNHNGGNVTLSCKKINETTLRISIADTGLGIDEKDMDELFVPFSRLYLSNITSESTGIGLTIVKQLVEGMGGHISVESQLGQGSTFHVDLKIAKPSTSIMHSTATGSSKGDSDTTMLYIEDSPSHIQLLEAIVDTMPGIKMISAHTPKLGLELSEALKPDIILLDICLPVMDGYTVLEKLLANDNTHQIPVIAISARAMNNDIEEGLRAGFRRYLTKPINMDEFKKAVDEILKDTESLS